MKDQMKDPMGLINTLVIDAQPEDALNVKHMLTDRQTYGEFGLKFKVQHAPCLSTGLMSLHSGAIDVVLLDPILPDSEGLESFERISHQAPRVPIIILSSSESSEFAMRALQDGACHYLVKRHVDRHALVYTLRAALERQRMQRAVQASEARFRCLIDQNTDGVVVVDHQGLVRFVNPAAKRMFQRRADEMVGAVFGFPIVVDGSTDLDIVTPSGEQIIAEMRVVGVEWEGERAYLASLRDISARERLAEQLRQAQKMEIIGRLAGGIAHEFNNFLTAILGYSDILLSHLEVGTPPHQYAERIEHASNRASAVSRQLLTFSRQQPLQAQILAWHDIILNTQKLIRPLIGEHISFVYHPSADLWRVQADPIQLEQLLMNLILNACDAMSKGGELRVTTANVMLRSGDSDRVLQAPPGPYVMVEVGDTGVGITREGLSHLFEPFFTTKEVGSGTGLGLAVVYGIVQQNYGDISVHNQLASGASFRVYFPRADEALIPTSIDEASSAPSSGSETVLLAEDDVLVRELIEETLQLSGYHVLAAGSVQDAIALSAQHGEAISLLISDVMMPDMTGPELATELLASHTDLRILLISGYAGDTETTRYRLPPHTAFLQKPFTPAVLTAKVRGILEAET